MSSTSSFTTSKRTLRQSRDSVLDGWAHGLELPSRLTVSEWADAKRVLSREFSSEPGRWNTDRAPYQREPMDAIHDPDVTTLVLKWSSQTGKSEILNNIAGYFITEDPSPILWLLPNLDLAEKYSKARFRCMSRDTPALSEIFGIERSRDSSDTIYHKTFPGGHLIFAGANSAASLSSWPIRLFLADEIDKYRENVGKDGDPLAQGRQRTENFWNSREAFASTPSIEDLSLIDAWYEESDQREFYVPCHGCGEFQPLRWCAPEDDPFEGDLNIKWTAGKPDTAEYACTHCGELWNQSQLMLAVRHGHWKAQAPFNGIAGFHINALYSPWTSMAKLAREWEKSRGKPALEQTFVNLKLGLSYRQSKEASVTAEALYERREDYGPDRLPEDVLLLVAGVDVQQDRLEAQVVGFGMGEEMWVVEHEKLFGDPNRRKVWDDLEDWLFSRSFPHPLCGDLPVEIVAVDSGYLSQTVYDWTKEQRSAFRSVYPTKGVPGEGRPIWRESDAILKKGHRIYLVGADDAKTTVYGSIAVQEAGEGYIHFPRQLSREWFDQLVSEKAKVTWKNGRPKREWVLPSGRRNEALDLTVLCMAARHAHTIDYEARRARMESGPSLPSMSDLAGKFR